MTLTFNTPEQSFTEAVQTDYYGSFVAEIMAYDGGTLLGTFTEDGDSDTSIGTAIFLGVSDTTADITHVVYSVTSCSDSCNDFTLGGSTFVQGTPGTPVPEPASLSLLGTAIVGFGLARRRRRQAC